MFSGKNGVEEVEGRERLAPVRKSGACPSPHKCLGGFPEHSWVKRCRKWSHPFHYREEGNLDGDKKREKTASSTEKVPCILETYPKQKSRKKPERSVYPD